MPSIRFAFIAAACFAGAVVAVVSGAAALSPWPQANFDAQSSSHSTTATGLPLIANGLNPVCVWDGSGLVGSIYYQSQPLIGADNWLYGAMWLTVGSATQTGLYALNGNNCQLEWSTWNQTATNSNPYNYQPVLSTDGSVLVTVALPPGGSTTAGGVVTGIDPHSQRVLWSSDDTYRSGGALWLVAGDVWTIGAGAANGTVFAVDATTGSVLHSLEIAEAVIAASGGALRIANWMSAPLQSKAGEAAFFLMTESAFVAIDITGAQVWSIDVPNMDYYTSYIDEVSSRVWLGPVQAIEPCNSYSLVTGELVYTIPNGPAYLQSFLGTDASGTRTIVGAWGSSYLDNTVTGLIGTTGAVAWSWAGPSCAPMPALPQTSSQLGFVDNQNNAYIGWQWQAEGQQPITAGVAVIDMATGIERACWNQTVSAVYYGEMLVLPRSDGALWYASVNQNVAIGVLAPAISDP